MSALNQFDYYFTLGWKAVVNLLILSIFGSMGASVVRSSAPVAAMLSAINLIMRFIQLDYFIDA
jgi:hypothetical protein